MFAYIKIVLVILLAIICSVVAGSLYTSRSEKNESFVSSRGVSSNYRLGETSSLEFADDINTLNSVILKLSNVGSASMQEPASVAVRYCGAELFNQKVYASIAISIPLTCPQQNIQLSKTSVGEIGIDWQLTGPALGRPLPSWSEATIAAAFLAAIGILAYLTGGPVLAALIVLAFSLLYSAVDVSRQNSLCMWALIAVSLLAGWRSRKHVASIATQPKTLSIWVLAAFFTLALSIRLFGITFGLPDQYHPDERWKVSAIRGMERRFSLNPKYFFHPTQLLYLTMALNHLGRAIHFFSDSDADVILSGRIVSALAGSATVPAGMLVAAAIGVSPLIVGVMMATLPMHVVASRYLKEDALLTFWVTVSVLFFVYHLNLFLHSDRPQAQKTSSKYLLFSALAGGLAAGSKYSGAVCILLLIPALFVSRHRSLRAQLSLFAGFLGLFLVGFLLSCPYSLLDYPAFLEGLSYEHRHMASGHTVAVSPWRQLWVYQFWRSIVPSFGYGAIIVALLAVGGILSSYLKTTKNGKTCPQLLLVLLAAGIFYLAAEYVPAKIEPQPERYVLPVSVFVSVLVGAGFQMIRAYPRWQRFAIIFCLIYPILTTCLLMREINHDTRSQMADWISENMPAGELIFVDYAAYSTSSKSARPVNFKVLPRAGHAYDGGKAFLPEILRKSGAHYFLVSSFTLYDFLHNPQAPREFTIRARSLMEKARIVHVESARFYPFGFHNPELTLLDVSKAS